MSTLNQLQPQAVWQWFEQICAIPHPSKHEAALSQHIQTWAKSKQLDVIEDSVGNLIIKKPATAGMENKKTVVIQAHIDMVPQKNADKKHDFETDPIEPVIDNDWVKANGTTLGADNGIGMASALAVLSSDDIQHGPLEVLLTIDEEAGMTGAFGLARDVLKGDILINTDSEQEGEIYMGCAGGVDASIKLDIEKTAIAADHTAYQLLISGLKGGHSGVNIHLGRGNANKLLARFLYEQANKLNIALSHFDGGSLRNAIPREATAIITIPTANTEKLTTAVNAFEQVLKAELAIADADVTLTATPVTAPETVLTPTTQQRVIALMNACPNGVIRMSDEIAGVTETSLNLGVITTENDSITLLCLIRSLIDSGRDYISSQLSALAELANANIAFSGAYPGWKPDNHSPIMAIVKKAYQDLYQKDPDIMVIHAGLECGLFKEPYPEMDMVSIGPTIHFPHSPDEKVEIATVDQYWKLLLAVLERIPNKS